MKTGLKITSPAHTLKFKSSTQEMLSVVRKWTVGFFFFFSTLLLFKNKVISDGGLGGSGCVESLLKISCHLCPRLRLRPWELRLGSLMLTCFKRP